MCENCGAYIQGNGYTDHCPHCLYGKHVDKVVPGDRKSTCRGVLIPVGLIIKKGKKQIQYMCEKCGSTSACKVSVEDNWEKIVELTGR